ncbi:MAG: PHP domain-containing protein [Desulfopila sp.]
MSIDLHIHSTFSDGTLSPTELVALARTRGLTAISITDHDTVEGTAEAIEAGQKAKMTIVPGIEMSVVFAEVHLHLLGYYLSARDQHLLTRLKDIQDARRRRNSRIIEKLGALGIEISMAEVERKSPLGQTGRPHIAQVLVDKGVVSSIDQAFSRFLGRRGGAYAPRKVLDAAEGIALICGARGIPVLAHPMTIDNSLRRIPALVERLVALGLQGIEAYYPGHSARNQKQLCALAERHDLVVTGGSDYHGSVRPDTTLAGGSNVTVPEVVLERLQKRRKC